MPVETHIIKLSTQGYADVQDLTPHVQQILESSRLSDGVLVVFVPGSTAGITTIEFEPGVIEDFKNAIARLVPDTLHYAHDTRWGDGNGFSHVRAALLGPSLTVPITGKKLQLGTWQQIILIDFDNRPRQRSVQITLIGE